MEPPSTSHNEAFILRISIVIPTLNEAAQIGELIRQTRQVGECEIIVVDGGSGDGTRERSTEADRILTSEPGRARQQNRGAASASGDVLLFLHSDCRLPGGAFRSIRTVLDDPHTVGGCYRQSIDAEGIGYRLLEWGNAIRVRWWKMAYGDQAIFVRKTVFDELGGFPDLRLMEDVYLMKRLRRQGRFVLIDEPIRVSARRWQQRGLVRQTLRNWVLLMMARCGVHPDRLARFYPHIR